MPNIMEKKPMNKYALRTAAESGGKHYSSSRNEEDARLSLADVRTVIDPHGHQATQPPVPRTLKDPRTLLSPQALKSKGATQSAFLHLRKFMRSHWRSIGSLVFLAGACVLILYAEIVRGWNEALFLKVRKDAILTTCEPQEKYDTQLVYVSCPVVYMHDFRNQLAGTFLRNIAAHQVAGRDLSGLSIELETEIFQWREIAHCDGCEPQFQDADGNCVSGHRFTSCRYTFEQAWVREPLPSSGFACAEDSQRCEFPPGGIAVVLNEGSIPLSLKSFRKVAESVSIGTNPGRYYLSPELIAQMPSRTHPLLFPKDDLPTVSGMTTSLVNSHNHQELRVERIPGSLDPSIGDVRSRVSMTDLDSRDSDRILSVVAEQGSYIHGSRHRTLDLWDSGISSWKNGTDMRVGWLREGAVSLDSIISDERAVVMKGVSTTITVFRLSGFACIFLGMLLIFGPLAKVWADGRSPTGWSAVLRDIALVFTIFTALALVPACIFAAFPWLHFWPLCGGVLLAVAAFLCILVAFMLRALDNWANLQTAMLEWRGISSTAWCDDGSLPRKSLIEERSQDDDERGVLQEDIKSLNSQQSVGHYGAAGESSGDVP